MLIYIYHPGLHTPERAVELAVQLEGFGYDGIAMPDHLFIPNRSGAVRWLRPGQARGQGQACPGNAGRDPGERVSFVQICADAAEARLARAGRAERLGLTKAAIKQSLGTIVGTGEEVAEQLSAYADAGCDRVHVQAVDDHVADRLAPFLRELHAMGSASGPDLAEDEPVHGHLAGRRARFGRQA